MSIFRKIFLEIHGSLKPEKKNVTLHEHVCTFVTISCCVLLRRKDVSDKICRENQNTHFCSITLFFVSKIVLFMWKNVVQLDRPQMTTWRMRIACWLTKAANTNTHAQVFAIFIACPLQQWLHARPSLLHYTYIAFIVLYSIYAFAQ